MHVCMCVCGGVGGGGERGGGGRGGGGGGGGGGGRERGATRDAVHRGGDKVRTGEMRLAFFANFSMGVTRF